MITSCCNKLNNIHNTIDMTPADASHHPDQVKYSISFKNVKSKSIPGFTQLKFGEFVRNTDKRYISLNEYTSNWKEEIFKS